MQALNSNVMKLALNLKARSMSVARVTVYNVKCVIMKAILFSIAISRQKCQFLDDTTHFSYVAHNFIVEFCHHWIYSSF